MDPRGLWTFDEVLGESITALPGAAPSSSVPTLPSFGPVDHTEDMILNSLYILANSSLSTSLVDHYFQGAGADYDVSSEAGVLGTARNAVWRAIEVKHFETLRNSVKAFICPKVSGLKKYKISGPVGSGVRRIDLTRQHSALGTVGMSIEYKYEATIFCECKSVGGKTGYEADAFLEANYRYDLFDQFRDAADWSNTRSGDREYTGGTRFNISGAWEVMQIQRANDMQ